jgi:hypothetical protein
MDVLENLDLAWEHIVDNSGEPLVTDAITEAINEILKLRQQCSHKPELDVVLAELEEVSFTPKGYKTVVNYKIAKDILSKYFI